MFDFLEEKGGGGKKKALDFKSLKSSVGGGSKRGQIHFLSVSSCVIKAAISDQNTDR